MGGGVNMNNYNPSTYILNPSTNGTQHIEVKPTNVKNENNAADTTGEVFVCILFIAIAAMIFGYMLINLLNYIYKGVK